MPTLTIAHAEHRDGKLHCLLQKTSFPNLGILLAHLDRTLERNEESNAPLMYGPEVENCWEILPGTIMYIWDRPQKCYHAYELLSTDKELRIWAAVMQKKLPKPGFGSVEIERFLAQAA